MRISLLHFKSTRNTHIVAICVFMFTHGRYFIILNQQNQVKSSNFQPFLGSTTFEDVLKVVDLKKGYFPGKKNMDN